MLGCPRCEYDQAGVVGSWGEQCPLRGVCSECGLEFAWRDVFVPPRCVGLVEHAHGKRQWAWWGIRTALGAWRPRAFWTKVRLEHPVRIWRAVAWYIAAVLVLYVSVPLVGIATRVVWAIARWQDVRGTLHDSHQYVIGLRWMGWGIPMEFHRWPNWASGLEGVWDRILKAQYPWWALPFICMCSVSPAVFLATPWTRAQAKVGVRHVARWWMYGQAWAIALLLWLIVISLLGAVRREIVPPFVPGVTVSALSSAVAVATQTTSAVMWTPSPYAWMDHAAAPMESLVFVPLVLGAWLCWWNWCALKWGMRLEGAGRAWCVLVVPTVLVGVVVVALQAVVLGIAMPGMGS